MKIWKTWESSPDNSGNVIVVERCQDSFRIQGIRYYIKGTSQAAFIDHESADAIFHAMTYFKNEGGAA
jgi:hypothetical protein